MTTSEVHSITLDECITDDELAELIKSDAFGSLSEDTKAFLRSDAMVERTWARAKALVAALQSQLTARRDNPTIVADDLEQGWQRRTRALCQRVAGMLGEYQRLTRAANRRLDAVRHEEIRGIRQVDVNRLRGVIGQHRIDTLADDLEPSPADLELWAVLDLAPGDDGA